jgi:transposase InsO family protein
MAKARRAVFEVPPTRRNRLWQTDFSEFETTAGGDWQLGGVVDYVAKVNLACPLTPTQTARFARFLLSHNGLFVHVRTRYQSPQTNGVIECFCGSIKYEHLYRLEIANAIALADEIQAYPSLYNQVRPHEALGFITPVQAYLADPATPRPTLP